MQTIGHYLFLGLDYLLAFVLLGAGYIWNLMPRLGETDPVIPDTPGMRMVQAMGAGWNLANTLESFHPGTAAGLEAETSWGNPLTTQAVLDKVKAAGFTCVRVPDDHLLFEANGASFLLLDRRELRWVYPEIVEAITGKQV